MPLAGHLITRRGVFALCCGHANEHLASAGARPPCPRIVAQQIRDRAMNDLLFIGLTVAFFALATAFAWFCEKVR
jgi:hypothetical protein